MFIENLLNLYNKYKSISGEIMILLTIIINFFGLFVTKCDHRARFTSLISIIGLSFATWFIWQNFGMTSEIFFFNKMYLVNKNSSVIKTVIIFGVILVHLSILFMSKKGNGIHKFSNFELPLLMNFSLLGILLSVSSNNLLLLYLSLELQALPSYILTAIKRDSEYSLEGGVKYFVLGSISSAIFLYGISLIYISLGTTDYGKIVISLSEAYSLSPFCLLGMIFILCGLMFKLSSAPLHYWIADIYQSAHGMVLKFFSVVPKVGITYIIYSLYRFVFLGKYFNYSSQLISFFAICSFIIGTLSAIKQTNFRRLLAYSTVANSGFFLLNVLSDQKYTMIGIVLYSISYIIASYGLISFACYYWDELNDSKNHFLDDLSGLARKKPFLAISVAGLLFSIAGIPPFIGFFGKFYILLGSISGMHFILSLIAVISTVISLIYYLGIIKNMYFVEPNKNTLECADVHGYCGLAMTYAILSIAGIFAISWLIQLLI